MSRATLVAAALATALALASPLSAQTSAEQAALARAEEMRALRATLTRIGEMQKQRPNDAMLQYYRALYSARVGDRDEALRWLEIVAKRRLGFHPAADNGFESLAEDAGFQRIVAEIAARETRVTDAREAFSLPDRRFVPEGIAYDPKAQRFFVGSVSQRRILERTRAGKFVDFSSPDDNLKSVLGLRVDPKRGLLYAVSTNAFAHDAGEIPENGLFVYDLATRRLRDRYYAPEAISLNDVAVAPDGSVAVSDTGSGAVYRLDTASHDLILVVPPGAVPSANGLDFSPDGKLLYVAHATGLAWVDVEAGTFDRLQQSDDVAVGAIDGLYAHQGDLIGVQNVVCPGRVLRIDLDSTGRAITGVTVLQAYHPRLDEPTTGTIVGESVFVIANSSVGQVLEDRSFRDESALQPAVILEVALRRPAGSP